MSAKQQRRHLPSLLYKSFFYEFDSHMAPKSSRKTFKQWELRGGRVHCAKLYNLGKPPDKKHQQNLFQTCLREPVLCTTVYSCCCHSLSGRPAALNHSCCIAGRQAVLAVPQLLMVGQCCGGARQQLLLSVVSSAVWLPLYPTLGRKKKIFRQSCGSGPSFDGIRIRPF